jgi:hypothetical protein
MYSPSVDTNDCGTTPDESSSLGLLLTEANLRIDMVWVVLSLLLVVEDTIHAEGRLGAGLIGWRSSFTSFSACFNELRMLDFGRLVDVVGISNRATKARIVIAAMEHIEDTHDEGIGVNDVKHRGEKGKGLQQKNPGYQLRGGIELDSEAKERMSRSI